MLKRVHFLTAVQHIFKAFKIFFYLTEGSNTKSYGQLENTLNRYAIF